MPAKVALSVWLPSVAGVRSQEPADTVVRQVPPPLRATVTSPVGAPAELVTVNRTVNDAPGEDGSGSSAVMRVVVAACATVTVACAARVTPPATAVRVFAPASVELKSKRTLPSGPLLPDPGSIVLPEPEAARLTLTPSSA